MSVQPAARVGDPVAHTMALPGALMGLAAGALIGVAIVATGGLGAIAIGAALATTGGLGISGQYVGESIMGPPTGAITTGSPNVLINMRPAARSTLTTASCSFEFGTPQNEATGAASVLINAMPAGRVGEKLVCSAEIIEGSPNVVIGGPSVQTLEMRPEVPAWLSTTMQVMAIGGTIIATGGVALTYGIGTALGGLVLGYGGGILGAKGARWGAEKLGFGETGQRVAEVMGGIGGGLLGGAAGAKGGRWFDSRYDVRAVGLGSNLGNLRIVPKGKVPTIARDNLGRPSQWTDRVHPSDIGKGTPTNASTRAYARSLGNATDDAGHVRGSKLGGSGTNKDNIFPQSPNVNRGQWRVFEKNVADKIAETGQPADIKVTPHYDGNSTRPSSLTYDVLFGDGTSVSKTFPNQP